MEGQSSIKWRGSEIEWVVGWQHGDYSDRQLTVCLPIKNEPIRTFSTCISWRCMQNGKHFRPGRWHFVLFFISFVVVPAAVVLGDWQIHRDQFRYLVK